MQKRGKSVLSWITVLSMAVAMALVLSGTMVFAQKLIDLNTASEKELDPLRALGLQRPKRLLPGDPTNPWTNSQKQVFLPNRSMP